jgi:cell division protease FtsH
VSVWESVNTGSFTSGGAHTLLARAVCAQPRWPAPRDCPFTAVRVDDPQLAGALDAAGVRYAGLPKDDWMSTLMSWALPLILFVWLWASVTRGQGTSTGWLFDVGKSRARVYVASETGVSFDDVAGIDEAREELEEVVGFLRNPDRYRRLGG